MYKYGKNLFNDGWQFALTDIDASNDTEKEWHKVEIPHDFLIGDTKNLYKSIAGFYTKDFTLTAEEAEKTVYLRFDGIYMDSVVFINGSKVGEWKYGYSSFYFNISDYINEGINNVLVRVNHRAPNTRWYSGAGIFRNVWLDIRNENHFSIDGIYVRPRLTDDCWKVKISAEVVGGFDKIQYRILDGDNEIAESWDGAETEIIVENPKLWDVDNPNLYTLEVNGFSMDTKQDTQNIVFGFRTIEFNPQNGFFLNNRHMKFHGVCMHHDLGALGSAVNLSALRRQLETLKNMGANAIRTSHNMPAPELISLCNEMGFLVDDEAFDMWEQAKTQNDYARFFPEWHEKDVASWVRRDRNAPCVFMWSIGNEIPDTHSSERGMEVTKMLNECVLEHDPDKNARVTIGSNYMPWNNAQKCAEIYKIAGYNYAENIYDKHHDEHPDWFIYGSETASTVRSRGIYHFPATTPLLIHDDLQCSDMGNSVVGWGRSHESAWVMDRDRDYCGGQFVWTGFDYIGEPTPYSTKNSYFGIIDTAGIPKNAFYFFKSVWTQPEDEPFVHIMPYWDWNIGDEIEVFTYSNAAEVELFLNGNSLGRKHLDRNKDEILHLCWKVKYEPGVLIAKAYNDDNSIIATDRISSFGEAEKIVIKPDKKHIKADGRDMIFVEISAVDKDNNPVANARNRVKISLEGAARLVGTDNGDSTDYDNYKSSSRRLFSGKLTVMLMASTNSGEINLTVTSDGLESGSMNLFSDPCEKTDGISTVDEYYPKADEEIKSEIPVRKILLDSGSVRILNEDNPSVEISAEILPHNASYKDISWKCVNDNGIEIVSAEITPTKNGALITAKGDGRFKIRAMCNNGGSSPQIISELSFEATGLGETLVNPYKFISAGRYTISTVPLNIVENGAISGIHSATVIGFKNTDFGISGSDKLILHIGNSGNAPVAVEMWLGNPENGGKKLNTFEFPQNGFWDRFGPCEFNLSEKLKGVYDVCFVVSEQCIFGGFEFIENNRTFELNYAAESDNIYGDDFEKEDLIVKNIGNNVVLEFKGMDFADGASEITICGRTPNETNAIQIRYSPSDGGTQTAQLLEFKRCDDFTQQKFTLNKICGKNDISFVFLPGSKFDFKNFIFGK